MNDKTQGHKRIEALYTVLVLLWLAFAPAAQVSAQQTAWAGAQHGFVCSLSQGYE